MKKMSMRHIITGVQNGTGPLQFVPEADVYINGVTGFAGTKKLVLALSKKTKAAKEKLFTPGGASVFSVLDQHTGSIQDLSPLKCVLTAQEVMTEDAQVSQGIPASALIVLEKPMFKSF